MGFSLHFKYEYWTFVILTVKWVTENIESDCSSTIGLETSDFYSHQKKHIPHISIHNKFV